MADHGVAITWGDARPGRESKALELFLDAVNLNDKAVSDGRMERWDAVVFEPSGNPPSGAIRFYGTQDQVEALLRSEDIQDILFRAGLCLNDFGYRRFMTGDALAEGMARYGALIQQL